MNYHSDKWVMDKVETHLEAANVRGENWVSLMAYGSQNYGLDTQSSDVDTRLIVLPSFEDIVLNKKPVSYTKILSNDEHIDFKDIRLFIDCLKKQNMAYLECIFTPYKMASSEYWNEWQELLNEREAIARYNPYKAVKTMKGIAMEKYHAMEHRYPTKVHLIDTYGYDSKQLMHLLRIERYLVRYIEGIKYADCLQAQLSSYLLDVKNYRFNLEEARYTAKLSLDNIVLMADAYCAKNKDEGNKELEDFMNSVVYKIMKKRVVKEMLNV